MLTGTTACSIEPQRRTVELDTGERVPYDRLVLATGARANVPTLDGVDDGTARPAAPREARAGLVGRDHDLPRGVTHPA